jgi:hypothetical protein
MGPVPAIAAAEPPTLEEPPAPVWGLLPVPAAATVPVPAVAGGFTAPVPELPPLFLPSLLQAALSATAARAVVTNAREAEPKVAVWSPAGRCRVLGVFVRVAIFDRMFFS